MKDYEKYEYVEIALPKDNQAVQNLLAHSEKTTTPLRVLVKEATILAYTDDEASEVRSPRVAKKSTRKRKGKGKDQGVIISDAAKESANSLLDDMGF